MTSTDTTDAGLTELTYAQLTDALRDSHAEYERRWTAFLRTSEKANCAGDMLTDDTPLPMLVSIAKILEECRADMDGQWASCQAQADMTRAITAEITARRDRGDYA